MHYNLTSREELMTESEFDQALREFVHEKFEIVQLDNGWRKLELCGGSHHPPFLVRFDEGNFEIHFRCIYGIIRDLNALLSILTLNYGGVRDTHFFFSIQLIDNDVFGLFLESKLLISPESHNKNDAKFLLFNLFFSFLFGMKWNLPPGIENLWK